MNQRVASTLLLCLGLFALIAVGGALGDTQGVERQTVDGQDGTHPLADGVQPDDGWESVEVDESLHETDGEVDVIVSLTERDTVTGIDGLQAHASATQAPLVAFAAERQGVTVTHQFWLTNAVLVTLDRDQVSLAEVAAVDGVERLSRDFEVTPRDGRATGDEDTVETRAGDTTYGVAQIGAPEVWDTYGTRGAGTTVTVLDTGIEASHQDLNLTKWAEFDSTGDRVGSDPYDAEDHGTHVSGTVAGGNETSTQIGVAPGTELHHGGVLTDEGGTFSAVIAGMEWAVENSADVVTMSLGGEGYVDSMIAPIRNAEAAGTTVVGSVGNTGEGGSSTPGNTYDGIGVGASNSNGDIMLASGGEVIDTDTAWGNPPADWPAEYIAPTVAAPGRSVVSTAPGNSYAYKSGTSMAAPHVAGAVALVESALDREVSPAEIKGAFEATGWKPDDWSGPADGRDTRYGSGIIDVPAAIDSLSGSGSATFQTTVAGTNGPVEAGSDIAVTVGLENTGSASGTETVTVTVGDIGQNSTEVSLDSGGTAERTLTVGTASGDAGTYTASVASADDTDSTEVTVQEPASFAVDITGTSSPVVAGEALSVDATVQNTGDVSDSQTVTLDVGPLGSDSTTVTLGGGDSVAVTLSVGTATGDAGTYTASVASADDTDSTEVTVQEPASFAVDITGTNSPVVAGEALSVDATVQNTGDVSDSQTVTLDVGPLGTDSTTVTLGGGDSVAVTLSVGTAAGDSGEYTASVASADDSASASVTVLSPSAFTVSIVETTTPVEGEQLSVTASVGNTGSVADTQTVDLDVGSLGADSTTVSLGGDESTTVTLAVATAGGDAGTYTATVTSADDTDSTGVTVQEPASFAVDITGTSSPVVAGETLSVDVTVQNTGDVSGSQTVTLDGDGLGTDSTAVSLEGGAATSLSLSLGTTSGDAGSYVATVSSDDESETATVTVQQDAAFVVSITGTNAPVVEGENLSGTVEVTNTGAVSDTQTVALAVDGLGTDSAVVTLAGGNTTAETFTVPTSVGDAGTFTLTASSDDDTDSTTASVQAEGRLTVSGLTANSPVEGADLSVTAEVTNTGDVADTGMVTLAVGELGESRTFVSLDGGETVERTLSVATETGDAGAYTATVSTADDTASTGVTVLAGTTFAVDDVSATDPVEGDDLSVTAKVTNTGDVAGNGTVTLAVDGLGTDSEALSLDAGETGESTLAVGTVTGDAGTYTASVATADDEAGTNVTVLDSGTFAVGIADVDGPVEGGTVTVTVTVVNTGEAGATQTVTLSAGDLGGDSSTVSLEGGAETTETLAVSTAVGDAGTYTATVASADDSDSAAVVVEQQAAFAVSIAGTSTPVEGDPLSVDIEVTNAGDVTGTETVTLTAGGLGEASTAVSLDGGETVVQTLSVATETGDAGTYTVTASTPDDNDSTTVTVLGQGTFEIVAVEVDGSVVEGESLAVTVTVENVGETVATRDVGAYADGLGEAWAEDRQLAAGETVTETLVVETDVGDASAETYTLTAAAGTDSTEQSVAVVLPALPGQSSSPQDLTGDGLFGDIDGSGAVDIFDIQTLFGNLDSPAVQDHAWAFDFDGEGSVDIFDVQVLFGRL